MSNEIEPQRARREHKTLVQAAVRELSGLRDFLEVNDEVGDVEADEIDSWIDRLDPYEVAPTRLAGAQRERPGDLA
jgi:hypothetical protein